MKKLLSIILISVILLSVLIIPLNFSYKISPNELSPLPGLQRVEHQEGVCELRLPLEAQAVDEVTGRRALHHPCHGYPLLHAEAEEPPDGVDQAPPVGFPPRHAPPVAEGQGSIHENQLDTGIVFDEAARGLVELGLPPDVDDAFHPLPFGGVGERERLGLQEEPAPRGHGVDQGADDCVPPRGEGEHMAAGVGPRHLAEGLPLRHGVYGHLIPDAGG